MKTKRTVIAACIATLFISGTVFAKDTWEYHENGWNNVNSYGKVVIAQDSVNQWGPWEDFVEPAAGAPSVALPGAGGSDPYRNNPNIIVNEGCAAGAWCGYAIFRNSSQDGDDYRYNERSHYKPPYNGTAGLFTLFLTPDDPSITAGEGEGPGSVAWQLTSLGTTQPTFGDSGGAIPADFGGGWWFLGDDGLHHYHTDSWNTDINGVSHNKYVNEARNTFGSGAFTDAITGHWYFDSKSHRWVVIYPNDEVAIGNFERKVSSELMAAYMEGGPKPSVDSTSGYYVVGIATPQAYLDSQRAGNVNATYVGGSYDGNQQGIVELHVQFGSATWDGTWKGALNFQVKEGAGSINGANLSSTNISALSKCDPATYSGFVQATVYGQQAGSIGGTSSVTKTVAAPPSVSYSVQSVQQQPQTQTQNAIFLVNRVPDIKPQTNPQ
jgi:hypothetical protein